MPPNQPQDIRKEARRLLNKVTGVHIEHPRWDSLFCTFGDATAAIEAALSLSAVREVEEAHVELLRRALAYLPGTLGISNDIRATLASLTPAVDPEGLG